MNQLENILTLHARRYPAMEAADYIKLLYQSEFGPGHMVAEGDALACLQTEFARAEEVKVFTGFKFINSAEDFAAFIWTPGP